MKKTYAIAPEGCGDYLTPGKMYETLNVDDDGFDVINDDGDRIWCEWYDWARVEYEAHLPTQPPSQTQVGGDHYLKMKIQPLEFAMANGLDACQTKIIKYICRDKSSKLEDLEKARHVLDYYIDWVKNNV